MLDDEEEEEVEMSEEYSDQEEYMEYSIVQHEVNLFTNLYGNYLWIVMDHCKGVC